MKITLSIRWYMLASLLTLMLLISGFFSYQAASYFLSGLDIFNERIMRDVALETPLDAQGKGKILQFEVVDAWSKMPAAMRRQFPQAPDTPLVLYKQFLDWNYFSPPQRFYLLMRVDIAPNERRYVYRYRDKAPAIHDAPEGLDPMVKITLWGIAIVLIFAVLLLLMSRTIDKPVIALQQWAQGLKDQAIIQAPPDFRYRELNSLAHMIRDSVLKVRQSLDREQAFLRYASHELRTPIAVLRSNCALLDKVRVAESPQEIAIRERLQRASLTMKDMTETLLWLSHEHSETLPIYPVNLGELTRQLSHDLRYLLQGKAAVSVDVVTDEHVIHVPKEACRILLTNIIRNSYQHCFEGDVRIHQKGPLVSVSNSHSDTENSPNASADELGFGLGLQLTEKLAQKLNWTHQITNEAGEYRVKVSFAEA